MKPAAAYHPIYSRDHRFPATVLNRRQMRPGAVRKVLSCAFLNIVLRDIGHIHPGTQGSISGAGHDGADDFGIVLDVLPSLSELSRHRQVESVQALRAVQSDRDDAVLFLIENSLASHWGLTIFRELRFHTRWDVRRCCGSTPETRSPPDADRHGLATGERFHKPCADRSLRWDGRSS